MQCTVTTIAMERRPPRKTEAARTLRLRALDRLAREIAVTYHREMGEVSRARAGILAKLHKILEAA